MRTIGGEAAAQKTLTAFGVVFLALGAIEIFYNELKAVSIAHSLDEVLRLVTTLNPYEPIRPEYEGHIVYIAAPLQVDEPLTEPDYGISVQAVKLKRRVQMYQWIEERLSDAYSADENDGGNYYYDNDWRDKLVDSSTFYIRVGHHNPKELPMKGQVQVSDIVKVGPLMLSKAAKMKFNEYFEITSDERPERKDIKMHMGLYYHSDDVWYPEVGDVRLQFSYSGPAGQTVSVVGQQKKNTIVPYRTALGQEVLLVRTQANSIEQMFHLEHADLRWQIWKMRGIGLVLLFISANCLSSIVEILVARIPTIRNVQVLGSVVYTNIMVSTSTATLVIAAAWVWHRPRVGLALVISAVAPFFYCTLHRHREDFPAGRRQYERLGQNQQTAGQGNARNQTRMH